LILLFWINADEDEEKFIKENFLEEKTEMDIQTDIGFEVVWENNEIDGQADIGFEVEWEKNEIHGQTDRRTDRHWFWSWMRKEWDRRTDRHWFWSWMGKEWDRRTDRQTDIGFEVEWEKSFLYPLSIDLTTDDPMDQISRER
jgi:hypothetical protein